MHRFNNDGGDGRVDVAGWYQGCGGSVLGGVNTDWDVIVKPPTPAAKVASGTTAISLFHHRHGNMIGLIALW
jgi:hypothetical protein